MRSDSEATTPASSSGKPGTRRLVLITGGCSGIGLACAHKLAPDHDLVLVTKSLQPDRERRVGEELRAGPDAGSVAIETLDLADPHAVRALRERLKAAGALERLHAIVHAAGTACRATFMLEDPGVFEDCMRDNYFSSVNLFSEFVPDLVRRKSGRVLAFGSNAVIYPRGKSAYAAAKAALETLVRGIAAEIGGAGVTANVIRPGMTVTPMSREYFELTRRTGLCDRINGPIGRWLEPDEITPLVAFLLSDAAGAINGAILSVDGGDGIPQGIQIHRDRPGQSVHRDE